MLDEEKLEEVVCNTANSADGLRFIEYLLQRSGCFTKGIAKDEKTEFYLKGWRDFGLEIRDLLIQYAPNAYIEIIKEGVNENERERTKQ